MNFVIYLLLYPLIWVISILPFPILYFFSDVLCFFLYKVARYRVKTVRSNIALALPELTPLERQKVEKEFYQYMCDMFLEMLKPLTISEKELTKRFQIKNIELVKEYENKGKGLIIMLPHYANWEWGVILGKLLNNKTYAIYKPLNNQYFDQLVKKIRKRFNARLLSIFETSNFIMEKQKKNEHGTYLFLSDQSPQHKPGQHWEKFMGVEVPVYVGAEFLARRWDMNILYVKIIRQKRGYYTAEAFPITNNDIHLMLKYQPTRMFFDLVEKQIKESPAAYFWTHNRWKHKDKER